MNTSLIIQLEGQWKELDLYEDIPISIVIQELDIRDLEQRKSPFSRTFAIPATSKNSKIFEHYYEVNGIDFNPLTKIDCVVQFRGTDVFKGILRLQAVINNPSHTDFEVYILGEVGDFASEIQNLNLRDLEYSDLNHDLNYDNIVDSWEAKKNDTDGLFGGKILYPLINYGLVYPGGSTGLTPSFTYTFGEDYSFDQSGYSIPPEVFKPSIRVKDVVDRVFAQTNYSVISEFFDTDYFKSIYMDTFVNGKLGIETASAVTNQNIFRTYMRTATIYDFADAPPTGFRRLNFETFNPDGYDPLGNFTLGNKTFTYDDPPDTPSNTDYFRVPFAGDYSWNFRFNFDGARVAGSNVFFQIVARKANTLDGLLDPSNAFAASPVYSTLAAPNDFAANWFFTGNCQSGEYVRLVIAFNGGSQYSKLRLKPYNDFGVATTAPQWDLYAGPNLIGSQEVDMKLGIPDLNSLDFIKALAKMFNLVIIQDEIQKTINFVPFNWYFNEPDRAEKDWTKKLDLKSTYKVEPLSFDLSKEINLTYERGSEEYLNKLFEDDKDYVFGRYRYVSDSNLLTGEEEYKLPFAAFPTVSVNNAPNFIIPAVYREINGQLQPYANKPHIFFWAGNRYAYTDRDKFTQGSWYLSSGATPVQQTTYPCVSHLSSLDIQLPSLVSDLNFGSTWDFFGNYNTRPLQYTPYNLYNTFWDDYIEDNYSNETRRLTGRFYLKPLDLYETKLTDKIFIKDSFYRIEKINDGDLMQPKLTEVSLIKERGGYDKVIPPAPYYTLSGNTPYPGLQTAYTLGLYTGTTIDPVCSGTSGTVQGVTFGVSGLSNNQQVYYDAGFSYNLLPMGTYVRYTGETDTYVVIDTQGHILEQVC